MRFLTFFMAVVCNLAYAENINQITDCDQILEQCPEAILFETEDRIYLRSEQIYATEYGLFVANTQIQALFSDASGCWLHKPSSYYWACWNPECSNYGMVFHNASGLCPSCGKPGNPS